MSWINFKTKREPELKITLQRFFFIVCHSAKNEKKKLKICTKKGEIVMDNFNISTNDKMKKKDDSKNIQTIKRWKVKFELKKRLKLWNIIIYLWDIIMWNFKLHPRIHLFKYEVTLYHHFHLFFPFIFSSFENSQASQFYLSPMSNH